MVVRDRAENRVFTDSNIVCFERLEAMVPRPAPTPRVTPRYGHQDPFNGQDVARDIFPAVGRSLAEHRAPPPSAEPGIEHRPVGWASESRAAALRTGTRG